MLEAPGLDPRLDSALTRMRGRLRRRRMALALGIAVALGGLARLGGLDPQPAAGVVIIALVAGVITGLVLGRLRDPGDAAFAEHLNRHLPALQESTQLLLPHSNPLTGAQQLQRDRTRAVFETTTTTERSWLPAAWPPLAHWMIALGLVAFFAAPHIGALNRYWPGQVTPGTTTGAAPGGTPPGQDARLARIEVRVTPPAYTGLEAFVVDSLDVTLPEGSELTWRLTFDRPGEYRLVLGDEALPLQVEGDAYSASRTIRKTGLYRVVEQTEAGERVLPGIHTLTVTLDRAPDVRLIEPEGPTLEIPLAGPARFVSRALARDDYGIEAVEIRASVAKGQGEGVKFRDEVFTFDQRSTTPEGELLVREWALEALGMEPGDEVYFFVVARDGRAPEANTGRSDTVIVRWLDEAPEGVAAEGFAIDLMPDYFKSQRQIIIETEQLIADRDAISGETFDNTSRALGQAQSDLKQRYGQYLGDEFEDGGLHDHGGEPGHAEKEDEEHEHDHEGHDEDGHDGDGHHEAHGHDVGGDHHDPHDRPVHAEPGHGELESTGPQTGVDMSGGADALISRFGHAHGAAEIGPITARNPVGMMKRSIANMWQAELHLLLSEPEKALPYEYEALEYLNLARQAERVYTRRLGFEPPPVSEERRLEGELDEILEYDRRIDPPPPDGDARLFGDLLAWLSTVDPAEPLEPDSHAQLALARDRLSELAQHRPALIRHAATLEKWRVAGTLSLPDCESCQAELRQALWTLVPTPIAEPGAGLRDWTPGDPLVRDWAEAPSAQEASP